MPYIQFRDNIRCRKIVQRERRNATQHGIWVTHVRMRFRFSNAALQRGKHATNEGTSDGQHIRPRPHTRQPRRACFLRDEDTFKTTAVVFRRLQRYGRNARHTHMLLLLRAALFRTAAARSHFLCMYAIVSDYITGIYTYCLLYTSPSPRDGLLSRMPSSA